MSLVGFKAQNHEQQTRKRGALSVVDCRATPREWFDELDARFQFTLDAAALPTNHKCQSYFTPEDNGLVQSWAGERVWINPPFSDLDRWVQKAWQESLRCPLIVMCVPANRTEQGWWQTHVEPFRDCGGALRIEFVKGRQRFIHPDAEQIKSNERPPFGVCLLIWSAGL